MLTVAQLVALETGNFVPPWHARDLFKTFKAKSLSLLSLIEAFEQQKVAYCVELRSPSLLAGVHSLSDLQQRWQSGSGQLKAADIPALQNLLAVYGITLKLVTTDFRRSVLVGTRGTMATVPTVKLTKLNLEDVATGVAEVGGGGAALATAIIALATIPEPASPVLFAVGVAIAFAASGTLFGLGAQQIYDSSGQTTPYQPPGTSSDTTQVPQPAGDSVDIPDGEIYGDPPPGVDSDQLISTIVNNTDLVPNGWDLNTGSGLPGFPDGSGGDGGLGGGGGFGGGGEG
jgi:hypothetical protein